MTDPASAKKIALVLSGGAARGAYEAGVIKYLREELPRDVRAKVRFDVLCGTSVGAVTACFLGATMERPDDQGRILADVWKDLSLEQVFKVHNEDVFSISRKLWRAARTDQRPEGWRLHDILHPEPLEEVVRTRAPWARISANLAKGLFSAISVSTTELSSGTTVVFVQRKEGGLPPWSRDPYNQAREAILGPEHALASAAIPLMFRAVKIGDEFYCDGFIRQNTPLSPALRLGAEKVLIVSLRTKKPGRSPFKGYPTTPLILGKVLNALLLDPTDYDLDRLRRFNALLNDGKVTFGPDFAEKLGETAKRLRGQGYRIVEDLVLRPSRDISSIAAEHIQRRNSVNQPLPTRLLHRIAKSQLMTEADLASYLLFDSAYANDLITLAMEDSHARREDLCRFFAES